ncbi:hypothetical protein [Formosa algae]|uniref:hypothetical protein n=1 Tax=Formosa algae TaxID=225843 RepID=UPI000CCEBE95|nr:hypothetical protein [Formosa algae]PNW27131.1 hypothetical protein BKP44_14410 [Formosa algae]
MKNLIKILILFFTLNSYSQKEKYLLFNKNKDSIVTFNSGKTIYYYIDKDRFLITGSQNDFNIEIDTISLEEINKIKFYSPEELSKEGHNIIESMKTESLKTGKLKIISTYNELFKPIYVIEELTSSRFKRTRVWWDDISGCLN